MRVWLTDWQVAEDHLLVTTGDTVEWQLYPADSEWTARLFGDRLQIEWQLDTYGAAVDQPSLHVTGVVDVLQSVWCRQEQTAEGVVPANGEASLRPELDTSLSWARRAAPAGIHAAGYPVVDGPALYGYVVSLTSSSGPR